jgi:hypothetical protein
MFIKINENVTHADEVPQPFMNPNIRRKGTLYVTLGNLYVTLLRRSSLLYQLHHQAMLALHKSTHYATKDTLHVTLGTLYATLC